MSHFLERLTYLSRRRESFADGLPPRSFRASTPTGHRKRRCPLALIPRIG
jgi:hypothetical protein